MTAPDTTENDAPAQSAPAESAAEASGLVGSISAADPVELEAPVEPPVTDEPVVEPVPESHASLFARELLAGATVAAHEAQSFAAFLERHAESVSKYVDAQLNAEHRLGPMEVAVTLESLPIGSEVIRDVKGWRVKSNTLGQLKFGHGDTATAALASYALGDTPAPVVEDPPAEPVAPAAS